MKAITIKQPWASLIVSGLKDIENRTWSCPKKYLGKRVLIHAAKTSVKKGWSALNGMQIKKVPNTRTNFTEIMKICQKAQSSAASR